MSFTFHFRQFMIFFFWLNNQVSKRENSARVLSMAPFWAFADNKNLFFFSYLMVYNKLRWANFSYRIYNFNRKLISALSKAMKFILPVLWTNNCEANRQPNICKPLYRICNLLHKTQPQKTLGFSLWRRKATNDLNSTRNKWRSIFPMEFKLQIFVTEVICLS